MPDNLLAGALIALPALLLVISWQLYILYRKVHSMSLMDAFKPMFDEALAEVKAAVEPHHKELDDLRAVAAAAVAEKDQLAAGFAEFKAALVAAVKPAEPPAA